MREHDTPEYWAEVQGRLDEARAQRAGSRFFHGLMCGSCGLVVEFSGFGLTSLEVLAGHCADVHRRAVTEVERVPVRVRGDER